MGKITIKRRSVLGDKFRNYKIWIDGDERGKIRDGAEWSQSIPNGLHTLQLTIDWGKSPLLEFELQDNDCEFECHSSITSWKIAFEIRRLIVASQWIILNKVK